jgi:hypothetical protein
MGRYPPQSRYQPLAFYTAIRVGDPEMLAHIMKVGAGWGGVGGWTLSARGRRRCLGLSVSCSARAQPLRAAAAVCE